MKYFITSMLSFVKVADFAGGSLTCVIGILMALFERSQSVSSPCSGLGSPPGGAKAGKAVCLFPSPHANIDWGGGGGGGGGREGVEGKGRRGARKICFLSFTAARQLQIEQVRYAVGLQGMIHLRNFCFSLPFPVHL